MGCLQLLTRLLVHRLPIIRRQWRVKSTLGVKPDLCKILEELLLGFELRRFLKSSRIAFDIEACYGVRVCFLFVDISE